MRVLGFVLTALAVCVLLYSCAMDVTVGTSMGERVINLHRLAQQASAERWGFGLLIAGVLMIAFGKKGERSQVEKPDRTGWAQADGREQPRFKGSNDLPPT